MGSIPTLILGRWAARSILGYEASGMVGRNLVEFLPPAAAAVFDKFLEKMKANRSDTGRLVILSKEAKPLTFQFHNVVIDGPDGPYVPGHAYDVTEIVDLHRRLEELAVTDDLTGPNNRRGFMAPAKDRIGIARRSEETLARDPERFILPNGRPGTVGWRRVYRFAGEGDARGSGDRSCSSLGEGRGVQ